jgi:hypothetical protein
MRKIWIAAMVPLLAACPGDKKEAVVPPPVQDTVPMNLDSLESAIPPAVSDSYTPPPRRPAAERIPPAPPELVAAVQREQSF